MKTLALIALVLASNVYANDNKKPEPTPPKTVTVVEHRGMCDGAGRALFCITGGSALIYLGARAAGWQGFGYEWDGGKKRAELMPMKDGAMFSVSATIN